MRHALQAMEARMAEAEHQLFCDACGQEVPAEVYERQRMQKAQQLEQKREEELRARQALEQAATHAHRLEAALDDATQAHLRLQVPHLSSVHMQKHRMCQTISPGLESAAACVRGTARFAGIRFLLFRFEFCLQCVSVAQHVPSLSIQLLALTDSCQSSSGSVLQHASVLSSSVWIIDHGGHTTRCDHVMRGRFRPTQSTSECHRALAQADGEWCVCRMM
jgi:hypothetical protein